MLKDVWDVASMVTHFLGQCRDQEWCAVDIDDVRNQILLYLQLFDELPAESRKSMLAQSVISRCNTFLMAIPIVAVSGGACC
jgi:hypothetical protein